MIFGPRKLKFLFKRYTIKHQTSSPIKCENNTLKINQIVFKSPFVDGLLRSESENPCWENGFQFFEI